MEFLVKLPKANGYDNILTVVDCFTKQVHAILCSESMNSLELAKLFRDNVWKIHGLPDTVISDRGVTFASDPTRDINQLLRIKSKLSTAYHPETNGQTEHLNREIEVYLRMYCDHRQTD